MWFVALLALVGLVIVVGVGLMLCFPAYKKVPNLVGQLCFLTVFGTIGFRYQDLFDPKLISTLLPVLCLVIGILTIILIIRLKKGGLMTVFGLTILNVGIYFMIPCLDNLWKASLTILGIGIVIISIAVNDPSNHQVQSDDDDGNDYSYMYSYLLYLLCLMDEMDDD